MNVKELIAELQKYDGDLPVICSAEGGCVEVQIEWVLPLDANHKITKSPPFVRILLGED